MLVLAAASVRADDLHLEMMQEELLGGESYSNYSNSSWYIKFSAKVEGEDIVSTCEIWTRKEGYLVELTALKLPYKYTIEVAHMRTRVIRAAKATAKVLKLAQLLPATVDDIAKSYSNMAESLDKETEGMGIDQFRFAVMYHSIIIRAALRIMNGAKQTKDICQASPDYEYAESSSLFICTQDLPHFKNSLLPHHVGHQLRYIRSPGDSDEYSGSGVNEPTDQPTNEPTDQPTNEPTDQPTNEPTDQPTKEPTDQPTRELCECIKKCRHRRIKMCKSGCKGKCKIVCRKTCRKACRKECTKTCSEECKQDCVRNVDTKSCRSECMHC